MNATFKLVVKQKYLFLILLPGILYYLIFCYIPMFGIVIAFKRYDFISGIFKSPWVGIDNFREFVQGLYFMRLLKNTILLSLYDLLWGFPIPIIFALFLNEIKSQRYKKLVQTISYIPHFISTVIMVGLLKQFLSPSTGVINGVIASLGGTPISFFLETSWFRTIYISSGIWQHFGWSAIIYIAALTNIDTQLYEAAKIDGAGRWRCMWHITFPGISPTIIILLTLRMGQLLSIGYEKVILMYNPAIYETADVINTYVYRMGIEKAQFSYASAVGLLNSVVAFTLIVISNNLSKKLTETSLW